jgi:hypothetical protein
MQLNLSDFRMAVKPLSKKIMTALAQGAQAHTPL